MDSLSDQPRNIVELEDLQSKPSVVYSNGNYYIRRDLVPASSVLYSKGTYITLKVLGTIYIQTTYAIVRKYLETFYVEEI